jgi:hypothetical protein
MSAPKVKASDAVSNVLGFLLACCSAKATGNRKSSAPQETGLKSVRPRVRVSARGVLSRFQSLQ